MSEALAVSVPEAAKRLSVGLTTMWSLVRSKRVPSVRIGRRTVIRVADLEAYLGNSPGEISIRAMLALEEFKKAGARRADADQLVQAVFSDAAV